MAHHIITSEDQDQELQSPYLKLYSTKTGNGIKVTALLELLGIDYYLRKIDFGKNEQKQPWYLSFNPNGKIPSITYVNNQGRKMHVNESIAIFTWLADTFDKERKISYGPESPYHYEQLEWLLFQATGITPAQGQLAHFSSVVPSDKKNEYAVKRFHDEVLRCFSVLEEKLKRNGNGYLVGDHFSVVDIAMYPYVHFIHPDRFKKELEEFPLLKDWANKMLSLPEFIRAKQIYDESNRLLKSSL